MTLEASTWQAIRTRFGSNLATTGEDGLVLTTTSGWPGGSGTKPPPLIYAHGSGFTAATVTDDQYYQVKILMELAQYFTVYVGDFGFEAWGNDTHIARIEQARTYLSTAFGSTGKVTLIGGSMGACGVLNYARVYPGNTRGVVGFIPVTDLYDMANNRGFGPGINAAYSGDPNLNAHNPVGFAASMDSTIPILLASSAADTVTVPSTTTAFVSARPQTKRIECGNDGHSFQSMTNVQPQLVTFLRTLSL